MEREREGKGGGGAEAEAEGHIFHFRSLGSAASTVSHHEVPPTLKLSIILHNF